MGDESAVYEWRLVMGRVTIGVMRVWRWLGLFGLAIVMRLGALGRYATPDEIFWQFMGMRLREGVLAGDWSATIQTGQPGIVTTWIGALGIQLTVWLRPETWSNLGWARTLTWLSTEAAEPYQQLGVFLPASRLITIALTAAAILLIVKLLQRADVNGAWIVGILLAVDPFLMGLSGLLISDALLGLCVVIALVSVLGKRPSNRLMFLVGATTALAFLNKLPGVILVGFVPFMWVVVHLVGGWRAMFLRGGAWLVGIVLTVTLLLPVIWSDPAHLLAVLQRSAEIEVGKVIPTFFMGETVANPSFLYYPLAILFRVSPVVLPAVAIALYKRVVSPRILLLLALFSILFLVGLEQSTRSYDRYALPVMLLLTIGAGLGIAAVRQSRPIIGHILLIIAIGYGLVNWATPLLAYNWLLGGLPVARQLLPVGWGEVESKAARQLMRETSAPYPTVFTNNVPAVAHFYAGGVVQLRESVIADITPDAFVLVRPDDPLAVQGSAEPVTIRGETMMLVTGITGGDPLTIDRAVTYRFVDAATLQGGGVGVADGTLLVRLEWLDGGGQDFVVHVGMTDPDAPDDAAEYAAIDAPLVDIAGQPSHAWQAGRPHRVELLLTLPDDLPTEYDVRVSLFTQDGGRIGVYADEVFAGVHVVLALYQPNR